MTTRTRSILLVSALLGSGSGALAQPSLHQTLNDLPLGSHWIYDDFPRAVAQARASGKPLLAVFR